MIIPQRITKVLRFPVRGITPCRHGLFFALAALLLCLFCAPREAEAVKRRTLLQLSSLRQWTALSYQYTGESLDSDAGDDRSSQDHGFEETYHLGINYAILSRRLANGTLEIDLGFDQDIERQSGSGGGRDSSAGFELEYLFDGILFERRPYPLTFNASRNQARVHAPFSESYDRTSESYGAGISLMNEFLPVQLRYRHLENSTDGLSLDRTQRSDEITLDSIHRFRELSQTTFRIRTSSDATDFEGEKASLEAEGYDLEGRNVLSWGGGRKNHLDSRYLIRRDTGVSSLRSVQWNETLGLGLGKALKTGFSYGYTKNDTPDDNRSEKRGSAWLEHQLFRSLTTFFQLSASRADYSTGHIRQGTGSISMAYVKTLPRQSVLNLSYSHVRGETDSNLEGQKLFVSAEPLAVGAFDNFLAEPDILPESVAVFDAGRSMSFVEGVDYLVNQVGRRTELIILSGGIRLGDILSVDYRHLVNSKIESSTTSNAVSASLSLFDNRYRLYANLSHADNELVSGKEDVTPLSQRTLAAFGVEGNLGELSLGANYSYVDSVISTDRDFEAFLSYTRRFKRNFMALHLREHYSTTRQKEGLDGADSESEGRNSVSLSANYSKTLMRNSTLSLRGNILDVRGGGRDQNDISFGMTFDTRWRKVTLSLVSDVSWRLFEDRTARQDSLYLKIRRNF